MVVSENRPDVIIETHSEDGGRQIMAIDFKVSQKWGQQVLAAGFTAVPNYVLSINQFLDEDHRVSSTEFLVLLQLLSYWWTVDRLPFPSKSTISRHLKLSQRQVQRALSGLEKKEFVKRVPRSSINDGQSGNKGRSGYGYDMTGLVQRVRIIAEQYPEALRPARTARQQVTLGAGLIPV